MLDVKLLTTGGTIDGIDSEKGMNRNESCATEWLNRQTGVQASSLALFKKDSREMSESDRDRIAAAVASHAGNRLLITHGTYTIAETGKHLQRRIGETPKTILLVGSWIPFEAPASDAPSQMEFALSVLRAGTPGIWIAMDGRLWNPATTEKREVSPGVFKLVDT